MSSKNLKVAIIICGQMRGLEHKSTPNINKNLIETNNADVFFTSWKTRPEKAVKFFKQKDISKVEVKESDISFANLKNIDLLEDINVDKLIHPSRLTGGRCPPHGIFFNLFLINKALKRIISYENENGFQYDIIVKTRPDLNILTKIECLKDESLKLSGNTTNRKQASDKLYYANRSKFFSFIKKLESESSILNKPFNKNLPWHLQPIGERLYKQVILKHKISTKLIKGKHVLLR